MNYRPLFAATALAALLFVFPATAAPPEAVTEYTRTARTWLMMCGLKARVVLSEAEARQRPADLAEVAACQSKAGADTKPLYQKAQAITKKKSAAKMLTELNGVYLDMINTVGPKPGETSAVHGSRLDLTDKVFDTMQARMLAEY